MKHFLKLLDVSPEEITQLLDLADQLKYEQKHGISHPHLKGKTFGMIFEKSSTRTRVSFEVGAVQLGAHPLFLSSNDMQIGRGEPIEDTAKVLSRYLDGVMIRTFAQSNVEDFAKYGTIPVINGLTDDFHPCQVMADLMTIREHKCNLEGLKLAYVGDGNNMANSLIVGCLKMGMTITLAIPEGYDPMAEVTEFGETYGDKFSIVRNPLEAAEGADVVYTDVWASMGQEDEAEKRKAAFAEFQVNRQLMSKAKVDAMVLHCLPAHRGEEISAQVLEAHENEIFDEAENRLHAQKAIMVTLMK